MGNENVLKKIKDELPENAAISDVSYEGSEIILYTTNKEFFRSSISLIKRIVNKVKKRIEVRCDPSILMDEENTISFIKKTVPEEAGIKDIYFEPEFAKVVVHAEKPGLVIGKSGETLLEIKEKTFWTPDIKRAPVIDSEVIRSIRRMLHKEAGYRKKFLNSLGEKIYSQGKDVEWVRLSCLGGFREVGRSCMLLQTPQSRVLMDCGMTVAPIEKPFPYLDIPEFNIQDLDAIVVSHSHIDHHGVVPYLYEFGYRGPIYCTRPTRDLSALIQLDYLKICQRENKKALYTSKGIEEAIKHTICLDYGEVTDITPDIRLTLQSSGHLLGSAVVHLHIGDGLYNVLYTADLKYEKTKLFEKPPTDFTRAECVIMESTYGSTSLYPEAIPTQHDGEKQLIESVKRCLERGGRVLIPSFAVGRGQDVIVMMAGSDVDVPIYLDGMVWDATAIHTAYPEFLSKTIQSLILHKGKNPFIDPRLKGIGSGKERRQVLDSTEPCVVISTSGMLVGGPVLEYLKSFAEDKKNMLLFVGYQGEGTLGRRIQKGWKEIQFDSNGPPVRLNLEIDTVRGLGGHSSQHQLISYLQSLKNPPRKVIFNHGDGSACLDMARAVHQAMKVETLAPRLLDAIRLR